MIVEVIKNLKSSQPYSTTSGFCPFSTRSRARGSQQFLLDMVRLIFYQKSRLKTTDVFHGRHGIPPGPAATLERCRPSGTKSAGWSSNSY